LQSEGLKHEVASAADLDKDEELAGRNLAARLSNDFESKLLLMFYDSVKTPPTDNRPPIMNASPPLIEGVEKASDSSFPIVGAGLVGDFYFSPTKQFCGSFVSSQAVVGTLLGGEISMDYRIMHGCTPKDGVYHTITKIEGPVIYELDGKPVVKMIDDMYGSQDWHQQVPVRRLTIGVNLGAKFGPYHETDYFNRLITGALPDGSGIVTFEPDLAKGTEIQFMLRDSNKMIESAKKNARELVEAVNVDGTKASLALYIDCAGRSAVLSDTQTEEASEVCDVLNQYDIPLLGFYSGVEIAPLLGKNRGLDWTGVLLILSEE
jgi:small ligand-binding sensory domain FIST